MTSYFGAHGRMPGHTLVAEGAAHTQEGRRAIRNSWNTTSGVGRGLCSCGDTSEVLQTAAARKAWHRQHKHDVAKAERA